VECQVLANRVRHIRSLPSSPEIFYEPTGDKKADKTMYSMVVFIEFFGRHVFVSFRKRAAASTNRR
jgi:hypothetical protein